MPWPLRSRPCAAGCASARPHFARPWEVAMAEPRDIDLQRLFELDGGPGPARAVDDARLSAIIAGALGGAGFPPPVGGAGGAGGAHGAGGVHGAKAAASGAAKAIAAGKLTLIAGGAVTAVAATVAWVALRAPGATEHALAPLAAAVAAAPAAVAAASAPDPESVAAAAPAAVDVAAPAAVDVAAHAAVDVAAPPMAPPTVATGAPGPRH